MIHKNTIPVHAERCSIRRNGDAFYLERNNNVHPIYINDTAVLLWQLADGSRNLGEITDILHDYFPEAGHSIDIGLVDGFRALANAGGLILTPPVSSVEAAEPAELCILFAYHKVDAVTRRHLDLLTFFNPEAMVIPLGHNLSARLKGPLETVDVGLFESKWDLSNPWRSMDGIIYTWFLNRKKSAKRYVLAEYDCHCTMPLAVAYSEIWDADVAARTFFLQKDNPGWQWFAEISRLAPFEQPFAAGVPPLGSILFSHHALEVLSQEASSADVFSEFRVATTAQRTQLEIKTFPENLAATISAHKQNYNFLQPGIFHPVKEYIAYGEL